MTSVAIIGAGPYGLSLAAYLRASGIETRIFGSPMKTWLTQMPRGMHLKSEGFASTLYDPDRSLTLAGYCQEKKLPYSDIGLPVPLETFTAYGMEFQKRLVPHLEDEEAVSLVRSGSHFEIGLANGETAVAHRVVVAAGISHFQYIPPALAPLPGEYVSHSSRYSEFDHFRNRSVVVLGAGASAMDVTAALIDAGAKVEVVARKPMVRFHTPSSAEPRPLMERISNPMTGLGPGWKSWLCTEAPLVFRMMPKNFRLLVVRKHLGPAAGWTLKEKIVGHVPFHLSMNLERAEVRGDSVQLQVQDPAGVEKTLTADHVIAATGYRVDLRRLAFLGPDMLTSIRSMEDSPLLSSHFESSVPGLYFIGAASANTFGPLARFAYGAKFTTPRLSAHLTRTASRKFVGSSSKRLELAG
ncbi:MAG TPA: NAD(P)-binding domain-containing protein [Bryobacteraceae bacterium]|nr:NAD(P)-binding domain-containing protein [Bryobacteraceae bacterium]